MNPGSTIEMPHSNPNEILFAIALERKRKQIDQEIAEFKAEKERNYAAFEQRLRCGGRGTESRSSSGATNLLHKRREETLYSGEDRASNTTFEGRNFAIAGRSDQIATNGLGELLRTKNSSSHVQEKRSELHRSKSDSFITTANREREMEFHGLFTPSYLPLLDSLAHDRRSDPTTTTPAPSTKPDNLNTPLRDSTSKFSSSATFPASSTSSPPPPCRQFSASVPRQRTTGLRRFSSRSDTSEASLRSSLRNPKLPRSPKHVLFAIDNVLVSPSASPLLHRSSPAPQPRGFDKGAPTNAEMIGATFAGKGKDREPDVERWDIEPGISTQFKAKAKYSDAPPLFRSSGRYYSSPVIDGHAIAFEPEVHDNDDLFAFDEDVKLGEDASDRDTDDDFGSDEDDEAGAGKDDLTVGSPRAGSLPIQIKWPGRRDR